MVCECPEVENSVSVRMRPWKPGVPMGRGVVFVWRLHPGGLWAHCLQASAK